MDTDMMHIDTLSSTVETSKSESGRRASSEHLDARGGAGGAEPRRAECCTRSI